MMELPKLPPYIYGPETGENERVFSEAQMRAYAEAAVLQERERILAEAERRAWAMRDESPFEEAVEEVIAAAVRQQKE
jgi:hypothetical protein